MNEFNFLLRNRSSEFASPSLPVSLESLNCTNDPAYIEFIKSFNGGMFFDQSLQIYGCSKDLETLSLEEINQKMTKEYGQLVAKLFFFACDAFGNQFCFDLRTSRIKFFNLESAHQEFIANEFIGWIQIVNSDIDYYTGRPFVIRWEKFMLPLHNDERLTAKIPFVVGGAYEMGNLRCEKLGTIIEFSSSIAKQIFELPDGTPIDIKLE